MLYLNLPATEGKLAAPLKEKILTLMFESHVGLLHAAEQLGISKALVAHDYRADAVFSEAVDNAERLLVMYESERIVSLADLATSRENAAAIALRVKTRERMRDALLPKWRDAVKPQHLEQHLHTGDTHITLSPEKQKELREQRRRIIGASRDAQRTLAGQSNDGSDGEKATSYTVKRQSLLVEQEQEQGRPSPARSADAHEE